MKEAKELTRLRRPTRGLFPHFLFHHLLSSFPSDARHNGPLTHSSGFWLCFKNKSDHTVRREDTHSAAETKRGQDRWGTGRDVHVLV